MLIRLDRVLPSQVIDLSSGLFHSRRGPPRARSHPDIGEDKIDRIYKLNSSGVPFSAESRDAIDFQFPVVMPP
jgi:hypothetical protein